MQKAIAQLRHLVNGPTQEPDEVCLLAPPQKSCGGYVDVASQLGDFIRSRKLVSADPAASRQLDHDLHTLQHVHARDKVQRMSQAGPTGLGAVDLLE
jgi:hypothetical protein